MPEHLDSSESNRNLRSVWSQLFPHSSASDPPGSHRSRPALGHPAPTPSAGYLGECFVNFERGFSIFQGVFCVSKFQETLGAGDKAVLVSCPQLQCLEPQTWTHHQCWLNTTNTQVQLFDATCTVPTRILTTDEEKNTRFLLKRVFSCCSQVLCAAGAALSLNYPVWVTPSCRDLLGTRPSVPSPLAAGPPAASSPA